MEKKEELEKEILDLAEELTSYRPPLHKYSMVSSDIKGVYSLVCKIQQQFLELSKYKVETGQVWKITYNSGEINYYLIVEDYGKFRPMYLDGRKMNAAYSVCGSSNEEVFGGLYANSVKISDTLDNYYSLKNAGEL